MANNSEFPQFLTNESSTVSVSLTYDQLLLSNASSFIKSPWAGANVIFTGTTRNSFDDKPVSRLSYSAYPKLALKTLLAVSEKVKDKYRLEKVYVVHRLGEVVVEEESIIVAVSSAHRGEGWRGAEELLELIKEKAEIWKREWFSDGVIVEGKDGEKGTEVGVWRANQDSKPSSNTVG